MDMAKARSKKAILISVSAGKGCYRHIKIPYDAMLEELAETILDAFEFDNDHAHAFFMDNQVWSMADCYYHDMIAQEDGERSTREYRIDQTGLQKGSLFKFLFDFGDEWVFQCRVLNILDEAVVTSAIVRSVGDPPEQYPDYESEDEEDEDE